MAAELPLNSAHTTWRAWIVLGVAFVTFLLLVSSLATGTYLYMQSATEAHEAILDTQGEVLLRPKNETHFKQARSGERLREGDTIKTQSGIQARLVFFDDSELHLAEDTLVEITQMRSSRFVAAEKKIMLIQRQGWSRLIAPPRTDSMVGRYAMLLDGLEVEAASQPGTSTQLSYELRPAEPQAIDRGQTGPLEAQVAVESGTAIARLGGEQIQLATGEKTAAISGGPLVPASPGPREYVRNGDFQALVPQEGTTIFPQHWDKTEGQGGDGGDLWGTAELTRQVVNARSIPVVSFKRRFGAKDNAVTGIAQHLNLPLSHFRSLRLRVNLQVDYHSLSGGGLMDTEYPVVVKITYRDQQNRTNSWYRGFYIHNHENLRTDHGIKVSIAQWHAFEQDLLQLNVNPKPVFIETIDIYAEGHDFQSAVAFVSIEGE